METKHFNSYKEELDLDFLKQYCLEHGKVKTFEQGEALEKAGEAAQWIAYVESGYFKYMVQNLTGGVSKCTGFAFKGELVADYPCCLYGGISDVTIEASIDCKVYIINASKLQNMYNEDEEKRNIGIRLMYNLFKMVYERYLDLYRHDAKERYEKLLSRCPQIVQQLSIKDIASFLNITPTHLSRIRKEITYSK